MPGALEGLRVLDLTQHLSGPYCAMVLADQGADVIKIEKPGKGDDAREMPPFVGGEGAPFMLWNRNKRSVVLDLKTAEGVATLDKLAAGADVLIENFRPGTTDRIGIGYARLAALNPRLIYCSISGFGQSGPYRSRGGFDLMIQAMSGLMSVNGDPDGPPMRLPIAISDVAGGMFGAVGILAALAARERSGRGQQVDVSLYESAVAFGVYEAAYYFATGKNPPRLGQAHRGSSPYQVFRTSDGWITVGGGTQEFWLRLCRLFGCEELARDPRFADNAARVANNAALVELLEPRLARESNAHWQALLGE
ncbi:MAG TPA: CoA transferase, partial [Alphaproteobacteria bacterium]|nr:CoA transferase [Alphaproteobacteria bacterium]